MPTAYRTCPLCEATCGLELTLGDAGEVLKVRGDEQDVFSRGFICPKGASLRELHEDPDRLRTPLVKGPDGVHREATWDEAFAEIERRLPPLVAEHGRDAVAVYSGNPSAHNLAALLYGRLLLKALGTKNIFSASTVDQMPKQLAVAHRCSAPASRSRCPTSTAPTTCSCSGANPMASNGSLMTAPDVRGRLRAIQARGGRIVVVDPRRTPHRAGGRRARRHPARAPTRFLLLAMVHVLFAEDLVDLGDAAPPRRRASTRCASSRSASPRRTPPSAAASTPTTSAGSPATSPPPTAPRSTAGSARRRSASARRELARRRPQRAHRQPRPPGRRDVPDARRRARRTRRARPGAAGARGRSRHAAACAGCPRSFGELPVAALAEEIETPGEGQVRALLTIAGNPVLEHAERRPPGRRARHARLHGQRRPLPQRDDAPRRRDPAGALAARALALRPRLHGLRRSATSRTTRPPVVAPPPGALDEWETLAAPARRSSPARARTPTSPRSTT